jgi:hypothetical protein
MAEEGICAYVQNLGIERGELLQLGVERRQLRGSSWGPVQRMKCHYHAFFPAKITELHSQRPFALDRGQFEIGCEVTNFQGHKLLHAFAPLADSPKHSVAPETAKCQMVDERHPVTSARMCSALGLAKKLRAAEAALLRFV